MLRSDSWLMTPLRLPSFPSLGWDGPSTTLPAHHLQRDGKDWWRGTRWAQHPMAPRLARTGRWPVRSLLEACAWCCRPTSEALRWSSHTGRSSKQSSGFWLVHTPRWCTLQVRWHPDGPSEQRSDFVAQTRVKPPVLPSAMPRPRQDRWPCSSPSPLLLFPPGPRKNPCRSGSCENMARSSSAPKRRQRGRKQSGTLTAACGRS